MREDVTDLLILIFLLGICMSVGYTSLAKEARRSAPVEQEYLQDKNTSVMDGYDIPVYGVFDGTFSGAELVLMTQIQTFYMPNPKKMIMKDENGIQTGEEIIVDASNGNKEYTAYANSMKAFIKNSPKERFRMDFDEGMEIEDSDSADTDDSYAFTKVKKGTNNGIGVIIRE